VDLGSRTWRRTPTLPITAKSRAEYQQGLDSFLREARTLVKFRHPNIVRVMSVFEANNSAYLVMEYERGVEFRDLLFAMMAVRYYLILVRPDALVTARTHRLCLRVIPRWSNIGREPDLKSDRGQTSTRLAALCTTRLPGNLRSAP